VGPKLTRHADDRAAVDAHDPTRCLFLKVIEGDCTGDPVSCQDGRYTNLLGELHDPVELDRIGKVAGQRSHPRWDTRKGLGADVVGNDRLTSRLGKRDDRTTDSPSRASYKQAHGISSRSVAADT
jgi:hypothetical protein